MTTEPSDRSSSTDLCLNAEKAGKVGMFRYIKAREMLQNCKVINVSPSLHFFLVKGSEMLSIPSVTQDLSFFFQFPSHYYLFHCAMLMKELSKRLHGIIVIDGVAESEA